MPRANPARPLVDNVFEGANIIEFFDAQGTQWSGNRLIDSDGVCMKIVTSDKGVEVRGSAFEVSDWLPSAC